MTSRAGGRGGRGELAHLVIIVCIAGYFGALLFWFGRLFVTGGVEEHVVMSLIIPVVSLLGLVAVICLSIIASEGWRAARRLPSEKPDQGPEQGP